MRLRSLLLLLIPLLTDRLAAQHMLLVNDGEKMAVVCAARGLKPCVESDGKLRTITSPQRLALAEVPEYLPVFVSVRDAYGTNYEGATPSYRFDATFETSSRLKEVFLALYLVHQSGSKVCLIGEVGQLEPNVPKPIALELPLQSGLGPGGFHLYIFSGGREVLQSTIPVKDREAALDRMVAARIRNVPAAAARPFYAPGLEYPAALKKTNLKGAATVAIRIGVDGSVFDPEVRSATDPAFGEAALAAVRLWRFLPAVKDGVPVETRAVVPIDFIPPKS